MNYSQPESKKENVIKDLLLELQASGRISKKSEDLALDRLGIKDQTELWKLIEESRKEEIIGLVLLGGIFKRIYHKVHMNGL